MPEMDGFVLAQHIADDPALSCPLVLMLNSMDLLGKSLQALQSKHVPFVVKPISEFALQKAIGQALGGVQEQGQVSSNPKPISTTRPMRILVAEDNPVNQRVITVLLEKRGHSVSLARNGSEAVDLCANQLFDMILMDVQMPIMNGYDSSLAIRSAERIAGSRTPIIALTAHAMKGDREECLNAGMDDYLTKPVLVRDLEAMLKRFQPEEPGNRAESDLLPITVTTA
jgi:CheY-like chemotaxis protein